MIYIPHTIFSTEKLEQRERYSAWRDSISVIFEVENSRSSHPEPVHAPLFEAQLEAFLFDEIMMAKVDSSAAHYLRTPDKIRQDGLDMILIQLLLKGEVQFRHGRRVTHARKNDLVIFDLSQDVQNYNSKFEHLTIVLPREMISGHVLEPDRWHGKILPRNAPMTVMLRNHLLTLLEIGGKVTSDMLPNLIRSTLELLASAFQPASGNITRSTDSMTAILLYKIKGFIAENLANPVLSPDTLAAKFGLSRAQFYRVTEPLDGIMNYIRKLRLKRCLKGLRDPYFAQKSVAEFAFKWGLNDVGTFRRSFKKAFGMTHGEARAFPEITYGHPRSMDPIQITTNERPCSVNTRKNMKNKSHRAACSSLALLYVPLSAATVFDNFDDGSDDGWTRYDPIATAVGGSYSSENTIVDPRHHVRWLHSE